ncbi:MAG TPA: choice-of-anchor E domain-containing protein [Chitinophagaceae bacterium]|nr:choice-of-anchor E domain-containing protein [Chitinophagaceae bacterium]
MKPLYPIIARIALPLLVIFLHITAHGQCPVGAAGQTAYDTTIKIPSGVYATPVKFPKFNPINGMLTCVKLCITVTGIIDSVSIENGASVPQVFNIKYKRTDQVIGPGFTAPPFTKVINNTYPIPLDPTDGVPNSGPDYYMNTHDTVLNETDCNTISDSLTISNFYGTDSVLYNYDIDVEGYVTGNGSFNSAIATSALVNFHFEYCTCPATVLPLNIRSFSLDKITNEKVQLNWSGFDDAFAEYSYVAEVSRNGYNFSSIGSATKNMSTTESYKLLYTAQSGSKGLYYFRIKQIYANGYVRYSNIKQVQLESSGGIKFSIYPNPSNGIVGIKFDKIMNGQFDVQIFNTQGQLMVRKNIVVAGSSNAEVGTLTSGVYWLRLTDKKSQASSVNQLLIK